MTPVSPFDLSKVEFLHLGNGDAVKFVRGFGKV